MSEEVAVSFEDLCKHTLFEALCLKGQDMSVQFLYLTLERFFILNSCCLTHAVHTQHHIYKQANTTQQDSQVSDEANT